VHAPLPYSGGYTFSGNVDFGDVNAELQQLRDDDHAPPEAYYYALVAPEATFDDYCGRSCVTGQSYVVDDPADADLRVGSGQGWAGETAAWTLAHEVATSLAATMRRAPPAARLALPGPQRLHHRVGYDRRSGAFQTRASSRTSWATATTPGPATTRTAPSSTASSPCTAPRLARSDAAALPLPRRGCAGPHRVAAAAVAAQAAVGPQARASWLGADGAIISSELITRLALAEDEQVEYALPAAPAGARGCSSTTRREAAGRRA